MNLIFFNFKTSSKQYYNFSFFGTKLENFQFIGIKYLRGIDNYTSRYETALRSGP